MKNWVLLFFAAFTLGFCLSYLISNPPANTPVAVHLNVATDNQGGLDVAVEEAEKIAGSSRRISLNQAGARARTPTAYAAARKLPESRPAVRPAITDPRGELPGSSRPAGSPGSGGLAGLLLDAARHELDGRVDQRDIILASIFPIIIRNRINEPVKTEIIPARPPALKPADNDPVVVEESPAIPAAAREPVREIPADVPVKQDRPPGRLKVVEKISQPIGNPPTDFRLEEVTFFTGKWRGLRDYDPGGNVFNRGEKLQFCAVLKDLEEESSFDNQDKPYARRFSAHWQLVDASSRVIDSIIIQERNVVYDANERDKILAGEMGFGVVEYYRLPNTLAPGSYTIQLRAKDHVAKTEATSSLELQVRTTSSLSTRAPEKLDSSDLEVLPPYEEAAASPEEERNNTADSP